MLEKLMAFHASTILASVYYMLRHGKTDSEYFEKNYNFIIDTKSRLTGELAEEIGRLGSPQKIIVSVSQDEKEKEINLDESMTNPLKGERFKGWLDEYISNNMSFFFLYNDFKNLHKSWLWWYKFLNIYSMIFAIFQILNLVLLFCFQYSCFSSLKKENDMFFFLENMQLLYFSGILPVVAIIIGIIMIWYKNHLKERVIEKRGQYHGI